jgi:glycosyltransferase involved in cell wall biosynthesis
MFVADMPEITYTDPWARPLGDRLADLARGSMRVAYFYENPDTSTFRYRVYNMIQALGVSNQDVSAAWFSLAEIDQMHRVIDMIDILVVCRTRYDDRINRMITRARSLGRRVFFDVDDLIFDPDYVHLVLTTLDQDVSHSIAWDFWFSCVGRLGATLRLCDEVIVTNDYLASRVQIFAGKKTHVIPNFLNEEQINVSGAIFEAKKASRFARDGRIHLGYFSGTPTHNKDFEIVAGALARLLERDPRLVLRVVGFLEMKGALQEFASRVEYFPLQDFLNLQRLVGGSEINMVPLQDNIFTNCKSELKYFEAGIVGTVTVASPTFTFRNAIREGDNGYLANAYEWEAKLQALIDEIDDHSEMAERAFRHSEERYGWANQTALIERTLFG